MSRLIDIRTGKPVEVDDVASALAGGGYEFDPESTYRLRDEGGKLREIPGDSARIAISDLGYKFGDEETRLAELKQDAESEFYEGENVLAGIEGLARGATLGLSDLAFGDEHTAKRRQYNPIISTATQIVGGVAPAFAGGGGIGFGRALANSPAGLAARAGRAIAGEGKIVRAAAGYGLEGALFGSGQVMSDMALSNKEVSAEAFIAGAGHGLLWGGALGGGMVAAGKVFGAGRKALAARRASKEAPVEVLEEAVEEVSPEFAKTIPGVPGEPAPGSLTAAILKAEAGNVKAQARVAKANAREIAIARAAAEKAKRARLKTDPGAPGEPAPGSLTAAVEKANAEEAKAAARAKGAADTIPGGPSRPGAIDAALEKEAARASKKADKTLRDTHPGWMDSPGEVEFVAAHKLIPKGKRGAAGVKKQADSFVAEVKAQRGAADELAGIAEKHVEMGGLNPRGEQWAKELDEALKGYRVHASQLDDWLAKNADLADPGVYTLGHEGSMQSLARKLADDGLISAKDLGAADRAARQYGKVISGRRRAGFEIGRSEGTEAGRQAARAHADRDPAAFMSEQLKRIEQLGKDISQYGKTPGAKAEIKKIVASIAKKGHVPKGSVELDDIATIVDGGALPPGSPPPARMRIRGSRGTKLGEGPGRRPGKMMDTVPGGPATSVDKATAAGLGSRRRPAAGKGTVPGGGAHVEGDILGSGMSIRESGGFAAARGGSGKRGPFTQLIDEGKYQPGDKLPLASLDDLEAKYAARLGKKPMSSADAELAEGLDVVSNFEKSASDLHSVIKPHLPPAVVERMGPKFEKYVEAVGKADKKRDRFASFKDMIGAVEMLQTAGVPGMPDIDRLPVIGPLLGAYAKYRFFRMAGRKIGVLGGPDAKIAEGATKLRNRLSDGVDKFIAASGKAKPAAIPTAAAILDSPLFDMEDRRFDGNEKKTSKAMKGLRTSELYRRRREELLAAQASGAEALRKVVRTADPAVQEAIEVAWKRKVDYLVSKLPIDPTPPNPLGLPSTWQPSRDQMDEFAQFVRGATQLGDLANDMINGVLTPQAVEAFQAVAPKLFEEVREQIIERAAEAGEKLSYSKRIKLSIMLRAPVDPSMNPEYLATQQEVYARDEEQEQPTVQAPSFAGPMLSSSEMWGPYQRAGK